MLWIEQRLLYSNAKSKLGEQPVATVELTKNNFEQAVTDHPMVMVDFWAPWCAPCRAFAPTFQAASEQHPDVLFAKVNTEEQPEIAAALHIRSIPTLMFFREQVILYAEAGALPPAMLEELIAKAKTLDMDEVHREIAKQEDQTSS
jgi:thioredoxin